MEDVLPWDYMPELFDYRIYFDEVCRVIAEKSSDTTNLKQLIYASLYRYLSAYTDSLNDYRQVLRYHPNYSWYQLAYAIRLMEDTDRPAWEEAGQILLKLVSTSPLALRAISGLKELSSRGVDVGSSLLELEHHYRSIEVESTERELEARLAFPLRLGTPNGARLTQK